MNGPSSRFSNTPDPPGGVVIFDLKEPLWARGRTDNQIRSICRSIGAKNDQTLREMPRSDLIQQCDYLNRFPQFRSDKSTLQRKCAEASKIDQADPFIQHMNEDELVQCIVDRRVARFAKTLNLQDDLESLEMINQLQAPRETLNQVEKNTLEGSAQLAAWLQQQNLSPENQTVLTQWIKTVQTDFRKILRYQLVTYTQNITKSVVGLGEGQENQNANKNNNNENQKPSESTAVNSVLKRMWSRGFDLVEFMATQPKIIYSIAQTVNFTREALCSQLALSLDRLKLSSDEQINQPWPDLLQQYVYEPSNAALPVWWDAIDEVLGRTTQDRIWYAFKESNVSVSNAILYSLRFVPFIGTSFRLFSEFSTYSLREALRTGSQKFLLRHIQNTQKLKRLAGIVDVGRCVQDQFFADDDAN